MKKTTLAVCVLFCILISLPLLSTLAHQGHVDANHNALPQWPSLNRLGESPTNFTTEVDDFLADNLAYRQHLLNWYSKLRYAVLGTSPSKKALIGKQGWLYFGNGNGIANARGQDEMSDAEAIAWSKNVLTTAQLVESYGGVFKVVIVPDKPQVYPEHLPDHVIYNKSRRRANKLIDVSRKAGLDVIDLLPTLLENKSPEQLYDKSDTHWTHEGGYLAYLEIMRELNLELPLAKKEDFRVLTSNNYSGDLARLLNLQTEFGEEHKTLLAHTSYRLFPRKKHLLVLGDSFSGRLIDFWNYSFAKTSCRHHRWGDIDNDLVKKTKADVVLLMIVERGLQHPPQQHQINAHNCF